MSYDRILSQVRQYYDEKIQAHGPTAKGVDWNSAESQQLRFRQLLKVVADGTPFTINDFGCGYGALAQYLEDVGAAVEYCGFDISAEMIGKAQAAQRSASCATFVSRETDLHEADYTVASGIFNVKLDTPVLEWENYILKTLTTINSLSKRGFAFNVLTKYSDQEFMRSNLYYADPLFYFDYCKTNFSRFVTLLHDYPLYEFTMIVRKDS
jgi:SAM-dependent methyltransferase